MIVRKSSRGCVIRSALVFLGTCVLFQFMQLAVMSDRHSPLSVAKPSGRKNVLFLVADDLRPEIGAYIEGDATTQCYPKMHTPNLDNLARHSLVLRRAYVQQALCTPSRTSFLTGRRIDTTKVYTLGQYWRFEAGNFTTIPQYFKEQGYMTFGIGKIFHHRPRALHNDPISWSEPYISPAAPYWDNRSYVSWYAADDEEERQHPLMDTQIATHAVKILTELARDESRSVPWFVAVGFNKPHLPFLFPARYSRYYPKSDISLPQNPYAPVDMPEIAWSGYSELRNFDDIKTNRDGADINGTGLPHFKVKELRRGYYAAVSYIDDLIGQVVGALWNLGLAKDTIISFLGDHGYQLGEHGEWCKHTNFELATNAPMMVSVPGLTDDGPVTERLTEFVDLFPTLVEAAGLSQIPLCPEDSISLTLCTEGVSFLPLMKNPKVAWKSAVFSQYVKYNRHLKAHVAGYRARTEHLSYTNWVFYNTSNCTPDWNISYGAELYDHSLDPEENHSNIAHPDYQKKLKKMQRILRRGWRNALPPVFGNGK